MGEAARRKKLGTYPTLPGVMRQHVSDALEDFKTPLPDPSNGVFDPPEAFYKFEPDAHLRPEARDVGMTIAEYLTAGGRNGANGATVKCNGCSTCCYSQFINIFPERETPETLAVLDLIPMPERLNPLEYGPLQIRKKADGSCVHLGANGCSVYHNRPTTCRQYDCRTLAVAGFTHFYQHGEKKEPIWKFREETTADEMLSLLIRVRLRQGINDAAKRGKWGGYILKENAADVTGRAIDAFYDHYKKWGAEIASGGLVPSVYDKAE